MVDPLCPQARWACEFIRLPLLAEDFDGGDKHAFWKALTLIAEHQTPPPAWLAAAMLKEFSEKAAPKNGDEDGRRTQNLSPEAAQKMYEESKADRKARIERLRERGLHREADRLKQNKTRDGLSPTMEAVAKHDMNISLAHLRRLLDAAKRRASQREALTDRLP